MISTLDSDPGLTFPVLIGDIGGTNARFAVLENETAEPKHYEIARTADHKTIDDAIRAVVIAAGGRPKSALLAVAGPVDGDEIDLTNAPWVIKPRQMLASLDLREVVVLNDFEAQALAVSALPPSVHHAIGGGHVHETASRVVLGPGTGLGVAGLVKVRDIWVPVAGEGGHVDLGPRTARDQAIWPHLETIEGRVSGEQVLCGRGLVNLYRAICAADGVMPILSEPAEVSGAASTAANAQAVEAVRLFTLYVGRYAGDLALIFMARGGVYIGGGIFQRLIPILDVGAIRAEFENKAPHTDLMRQVPLFVVTASLAALTGLAAYARAPRRYGIETAERRWMA
ncbi:glucokinase [Consotaella salsifontis]|uniref:Glucokinase n=1 Tax=Consotaella salsifontis TaxID=1365950 RepID=A0A1T4S0I9_9HYPH|nr:glucokinase [Consotaella salsifontis]SKA21321.1 glucokinase [Consotaella salsifontis]